VPSESASQAPASAPGIPGLKDRLIHRLKRARGEGWGDLLFVPLVCLAIAIYLSIANQYFLTSLNLTNVLLQATILAIVAFGSTFVLISGELDLSVGAGVALVSVISAWTMLHTGSIPLGLLAGMGAGVLLGLINGFIVTRLEVPSFIGTFATLVIANGIALAITKGGTIFGLPAGLGDLANSKFLGFEWIIWWMVAVFIVAYFIQSQTAFGTRIFAVGGNPEAARLSGIPVKRIHFICFLISGISVGIAGLALTARVESGQPNAAALLNLEAVAAIVVGGTSLYGGRGSVARTVWGVLLLTLIDNGLDLQQINPDLKNVTLGLVLIAAASADFFRRRLRERRAEAAIIGEAELTEPTRGPPNLKPPLGERLRQGEGSVGGEP
jgi:ribose/xylose/arabinose/galactoside ABC-type transport system permease subunit